jgi:hypothetical protein
MNASPTGASSAGVELRDSEATPPHAQPGVAEIAVGPERVDLAAALRARSGMVAQSWCVSKAAASSSGRCCGMVRLAR